MAHLEGRYLCLANWVLHVPAQKKGGISFFVYRQQTGSSTGSQAKGSCIFVLVPEALRVLGPAAQASL